MGGEAMPERAPARSIKRSGVIIRERPLGESESREPCLDFSQDEFLEAHSRNDMRKLVDLYGRLGRAMLDAGETNAGCFYLTQSYVFALESGDPRTQELKTVLVAHGREE